MTIQPKGYEATKRRFEELKDKLDEFRGRPSEPEMTAPSPFPAPMAGQIGDSFAPLDPMSSAVRLRGIGAPPHLAELIQRAAGEAGVDPMLFDSLVAMESAYDPKSVSHTGASGLAQLMPGTARLMGVKDVFDPWQNLKGGASYLAQMLRQFGGDEELALAAYNAGPGNVKRHNGVPPFGETQAYVKRVLSRVNALRGR
ncbi:MAG: lytic transglycosylase domain-containing protein [Fimbriimonadaceae bacterium]|nr:lytic transglycosylase domain-containing protein [Fimbriimonadaceae bacterium]QYK54701.1 MAG: lytic transglycosylase domain-containing protein [Fimbriimonadaceae bacterium]